MKTLNFSLVLVCLAALTVAGRAESRTWTSRDGKTLVGEARAVTAQEVQLLLKDGRLVKLPVDKLSAKDQTWVEDTLAAKDAQAVEARRLNGGAEGPYAGKLTGGWQKMTSADGLPFEIWGPAPAKVKAKDKEKPKTALPLVIYLHGAGGRGDDNEKQLEPGARVFTAEANQAKHACLVIAPQCPADGSWGGDVMAKMLALVHHAADNLPVDRDRIYVHGFSMGGHGTYQALEKEPGLFAAGVPVAGGGNPRAVDKYKAVPVWAFVGELDKPETVAGMKSTAEALTAAGGVGKITTYPDGDHLVHNRVAQDPLMHEWLFQQSRKKADVVK